MRDRFRAGGLDSPELDARLLAEAAFGFSGAALAIKENEAANPDAQAVLEGFAARRLNGEPVARILGAKEFYGLNFKLNAASLVPRPETELLVDLALKHLNSEMPVRILDLGTGSGCIGISVLHHLPRAQCVGVDLSAEALVQAAENARALGVGERFEVRQGSWYGPIGRGEKFDAIIANPPYIAAREILGLDIEVSAFDPILALSAGTDGLEPYGPIIQGAGAHLCEGGLLALECGQGQADEIAKMGAKAGFTHVQTHNDLAGIARAITAIG